MRRLALFLVTATVLRSADVKTLDLTWKDEKRGREVPVRIYFDAAATGPAPIIIFSHGMGGNREGYSYLGESWAENGFISVHPQHAGSDSAIWANGGLIEATLPERIVDSAINRALDVKFVIDELDKASHAEGPLNDRLKMDSIGIAGHSFGANTTLLASGMTLWSSPQGQNFFEPRLRAALVMSPQAQRIRPADGFATVKLPVFHMTGTEDTTPLRGKTLQPEERLDPFKWITGVDQYLLVFNGGDHLVFSGRTRSAKASDAPMQDQIKKCSLAWWKSQLLGNQEAEKWLREKCAAELGALGTLRFKGAKEAATESAGPKPATESPEPSGKEKGSPAPK